MYPISIHRLWVEEKGTPVGMVYRAQGPSYWAAGRPASELAYEVGWANALHLRPALSYPRSYITLINAVPANPSQHDSLTPF
eukprot:4251117-Pyramimonas_sp.AAC.2